MLLTIIVVVVVLLLVHVLVLLVVVVVVMAMAVVMVVVPTVLVLLVADNACPLEEYFDEHFEERLNMLGECFDCFVDTLVDNTGLAQDPCTVVVAAFLVGQHTVGLGNTAVDKRLGSTVVVVVAVVAVGKCRTVDFGRSLHSHLR